MMVTMFGLFAEIERDLISERTREGLQNARDKGKNLGRPKGNGKSKLDGKEAEIKILLDKNVTKAILKKIRKESENFRKSNSKGIVGYEWKGIEDSETRNIVGPGGTVKPIKPFSNILRHCTKKEKKIIIILIMKIILINCLERLFII
jgi:hypothetical protein